MYHNFLVYDSDFFSLYVAVGQTLSQWPALRFSTLNCERVSHSIMKKPWKWQSMLEVCHSKVNNLQNWNNLLQILANKTMVILKKKEIMSKSSEKKGEVAK